MFVLVSMNISNVGWQSSKYITNLVKLLENV